jgi:hypothetical protein
LATGTAVTPTRNLPASPGGDAHAREMYVQPSA